MREWVLTAAAGVAAFVVIAALALFCKAEAATWKKPENSPP